MPKTVAVAWSGGADSTALLLKLKDLAFDVQAWHVDHGWHENSSVVVSNLSEQAAAWGIPFYAKRIEKTASNIEAEARRGRYAAFVELAAQTKCNHIALGHHADDQAETVFMRLLQGAGVAGCQGMKVCRTQAGIVYWRPLLAVARCDIEAGLNARHIDWLDDLSNKDTTLWRNKIRHQLFPAMLAAGVNPQSLFLRWQKQATKIQQMISEMAADVQIIKHKQEKGEWCELDWQQWIALAVPVRVYVLQNMVGLLFEDGSVFGRRHLLAIEDWCEHGGHGWLNLSGCCLYREGQGLHLCRGKVSLRASAKNVLKG